MNRLAVAALLLLSGCATQNVGSSAQVPTVRVTESGDSDLRPCQARAATLRAWRDRLALRDWTLNLHCAPPPGFEETADGLVEIFSEERAADIWIHPDADDPDLVAIHELLHLWFAQICEDGGDVLEEQGLRVIARLVRGG